MKQLILILITLLFNFNLYGQDLTNNKKLYQKFGTFELVNGSNVVSITGFVTIEKIDSLYDNNFLKIEQKLKKENIEPTIFYKYNIYLISKSIFNNDTTSTWLSGVKIYINNNDILNEQFPNGYILLIKTKPTLIYTYIGKTSKIRFDVKWEKSIYESRIRK